MTSPYITSHGTAANRIPSRPAARNSRRRAVSSRTGSLAAVLLGAASLLLTSAAPAVAESVSEPAAEAQSSSTPAATEEAPMKPHRTFDHSSWTAVLSQYVDEDGMVDYEGLARNSAVFDRYVRTIEEASPRSAPQRFPSRDDALAYYLNAYNALVFDGVIDRGPEKKSVWRGLVSGLNFFVRMKVTVGGESMNLKSLEEKIILREFQDPRVHAGLNCASISCPRLPQEAFLPETLDEQLDAAMREWVNDPRHTQVDHGAKVVRLNKIFDWFASDFLDFEKRRGNAKPNQIDYVNRYRDADQQLPRDYALRFLPYDKGINSQGR